MNVISPIWLNIVSIFATIAAILIGTTWLLVYAFGWCPTIANAGFGEENCDYKDGLALKAAAKKLIIPFIVAFTLAIFVPSEKTVYKVMVANLATYENIDIAADTIEEAFDHVIDKLGDKEK